MKMDGETLKGLIVETINEYEFGGIEDFSDDNEATGEVSLSLDDLVTYMPDCEVKRNVESNPDLLDELFPDMAFDYTITLAGERKEGGGDYYTTPYSWAEGVYIKSDDGLVDNIKAIKNGAAREAMVQAFQAFEKEVRGGLWDSYVEA